MQKLRQSQDGSSRVMQLAHRGRLGLNPRPTDYYISPCAKRNGHSQATGLGPCGPENADLKSFSCVRGNMTPRESKQICLGGAGCPAVEVQRRERLGRVRSSLVEKGAFALDLG